MEAEEFSDSEGGRGPLAQILPGGGLQLPRASESLGGLITTQLAGSCPVSF